MKLTAATKVYAVIGDPVGHSLSPVMHNGWIADHGLDAVYVALPLRSADPVAAIRALGQFGVKGVNVTVPHKEAAAAAAGWAEGDAANVLRWEDDSALVAFNTDGAGFLDALAEAEPDWLKRVANVAIVGAGGAARGVAEALSPHVSAITFVNRTLERAQEAASGLRLMEAKALPWTELERAFAAADLIVQATTLGMARSAAPDWPVAACKPTAIVADIVYRPLETDLLRAARARGLVAMDGLGMLIHQGARAFELWFGIAPDVGNARARLLEALGR